MFKGVSHTTNDTKGLTRSWPIYILFIVHLFLISVSVYLVKTLEMNLAYIYS